MALRVLTFIVSAELPFFLLARFMFDFFVHFLKIEIIVGKSIPGYDMISESLSMFYNENSY